MSACNLPSEPLTEAAAEASQPRGTGEILQELHTINAGEIALAQLALQKSQDPQVQQTARLIIRDHSALDQRVPALAKAQGAQVALIETALARLSGFAFDREYLARNVELHEIALDTVRTDPLPAADVPQLRGLLTDAIPQLEQHLQHARQGL